MRPRLSAVLLLTLLCFWLQGCGGGGGSSTSQTTPIHLDIHWAARSKAIDAPDSALSAVLTLTGAAPGGGNLVYPINRDPALIAYTGSYQTSTNAVVGSYPMTVNFYAQSNGTGAIVGVAQSNVTIHKDGTGIGNVTTAGSVSTVTVNPNQTINVGQTSNLTFSATDASNNVLALSPGSAFFTLTGGSDKLQLNSTSGSITGLAVGTAQATVTIDGKTSPAQTVTVNGGVPGSVTISPPSATIQAGGAQTFSATVVGLSGTNVTWSVQEGTAGGAVTSSGAYTAPGAAGTYHVVATSVADPTKSATATVTVTTAPTVSVALAPSPVTVAPNGVETFTATVSGSANTAVTWSVQEGASGGSVTSGGVYTAPSTNGTYHVVATSVADTSKSGIATITVTTGPAISVAVTPSTITLAPNAAQTFTATVSGSSNTAVTWSVQEGTSGGTVTSGGVYTAPSTNGTYHVNATSVVDTSKKGTAAVTIQTTGGVDPSTVGPGEPDFGSNPGLYTSDSVNGRIVRVDDFTGKNWTTFGTPGSGVNQFNYPGDVSVDRQGHIYIADRLNHRIVRINDMTGAGWVTFGTHGSGINQFNEPSGILIDTLDRIYVVDRSGNRLVRIDDMTGKNWIAFGTHGSGINQFDGPSSILLDANGRIYMTDDRNGRVIRFDDLTGKNWIAYGADGEGVGEFGGPGCVALDSQGRIYIGDEDNARVVRIDDMTGKNWTEYQGPSGNPFLFPDYLAFDKQGRLYIDDRGNSRFVRIDDFNGTNYTTLGSVGFSTGHFTKPWGFMLK